MVLLAALLAAAAVSLALPVRARLMLSSGKRGRLFGGAPVWVAALAASGAAMIVLLDGRRLVLGIIVVGSVSAVLRVVRRSRERSRAAARTTLVLACCDTLAGDLQAGQPPIFALRHAAQEWAEFAPVATAGLMGADVPDALRNLATRPGASQLRLLAAAWQVTAHTGAGLADAIGRTAEELRARRRTERLIGAELAAAEATSRLLAVLPIGVLLMGTGVGGDPVHFLLDTAPGLGCLAFGLALSYAGMMWLDRIADAVRP